MDIQEEKPVKKVTKTKKVKKVKKVTKVTKEKKVEKKVEKKSKLNKYFDLMLDAKKRNLESFVYKDNKYVQAKTKTGLVIYKKEQ